MSDLSRHNHYAPQGYLKAWSSDGQTVMAYRTLVPAEKYPEWEPKSLRGVAFHTNFYTSVAGGGESDEIERWLNEEFEVPAAEALRKVRRG